MIHRGNVLTQTYQKIRFVLAVNTLNINCKITHFSDLLDQILQIKTHTYHLDRVGFDSPELSDSQVCMAIEVDS